MFNTMSCLHGRNGRMRLALASSKQARCTTLSLAAAVTAAAAAEAAAAITVASILVHNPALQWIILVIYI